MKPWSGNRRELLQRVAVQLLLTLLIAGTLHAEIHQVPGDHPTIQGAIDASVDGDTVLVAPGTFPEHINFSGRRISVGSHYLTTGDIGYVAQTVIDGGQSGSVVEFTQQEDSLALLTGFTITGGDAFRGGGIYCLVSSPTLRRLVIGVNQAESGGGLACLSASPRLEQVEFIANQATGGGGGIYITGPIAAPSLTEVILEGNQAVSGGGLQIHNSSPSLSGLMIIGNQAESGGGIHCYLASPELTWCVIAGNNAATGGGIHCSGSTLTLDQLTIANNQASSGGGLYCDAISAAVITNSILRDSYLSEIEGLEETIAISWSAVFGGWPGEGNLDLNPLFCNPLRGDYTLAENSPCLGAGQNGGDMGALPAGCDPITDSWSGPVWHVAPDGSDAVGDGSPAGPLATVQYAINSTAPLDTVLLQPGTYTENIDFHGRSITVGSLYLLTGDTAYVEETVIAAALPMTVVNFSSAETCGSRLCGLRITGGEVLYGGGIFCAGASPRLEQLLIDGNSAFLGGGVCCRDGAAPELVGVTITDNSSGWWGGGIYCGEESAPLFLDCAISGNDGMFGGGLFCWSGAQPRLEGLRLLDNNAVYDGGGIFSGQGAGLDLLETMISGNSAGGSGGGICLTGQGMPRLTGVLVNGNSAANGGGIACRHLAMPLLSRVTLVDNSAQIDGGGFWAEDSTTLSFANAILWNNLPQAGAFGVDGASCQAAFVCCDVENGIEGIETYGNGVVEWLADNIDLDPLFCDPIVEDYRLQADSPCRTDICGYMGYTGETCAGEGVPPTGAEPGILPERITLSQNYPNPFNPVTVIEFSLPSPQTVNLSVCNLRGQRVAVLAKGRYNPGTHSVYFNGSEFASGVYVYRLMTDSETVSRKMVLVR